MDPKRLEMSMADERFYIENPLPDSSGSTPDRWEGFADWIEVEDDDEALEAELEMGEAESPRRTAAQVREVLDAQVADVSSRRAELVGDKERIARRARGQQAPSEPEPAASDPTQEKPSIDLDSYESIDELQSYWEQSHGTSQRRRRRSSRLGGDIKLPKLGDLIGSSGAESEKAPRKEAPAAGSAKAAHAQQARKGRASGDAQAALARAKAKAAAERKERSLANKIGLGIAAVVAALVLGFTVYVGGIRSDISTLSGGLDSIKEDLLATDSEAIVQDVEDIEKATKDLRSKMSGPLWDLVSRMPNVAVDLANAEVLVDVLDNITQSGLRPLADNASLLSMSGLLADGNVNMDALSTASEILSGLGSSVRSGSERLSALTPGTVGQINAALIRAQESLSSADELIGDSAELMPQLTELLGASGQKHYLIAALNTAESRPGGGMVGSLGLMTVENGKMELGDFFSPHAFDPTQVEVSDSQRALMQVSKNMISPHRYTVNSTLWPNFPDSARTIAAHWMKAYPDGGNIDGVIAVDPSFLQELLRIGGIEVTTSRGETINGSNASQILLNGVYWNVPEKEQDSYFAEVADLCFDTIRERISSFDASNLLEVLRSNGGKRHLMMWFENEDAQSLADSLGLTGALPTDPAAPQTGLYYYCIPGCKLTWYLERDVWIEQYWANTDGSVTYQMRAKLTNGIDAETVEAAPEYVKGKDRKDDLNRKAGDLTLQLFLYAPAGGFISDISILNDYDLTANTEYGFGQLFIDDTQIITSHLKLAPGQTIEFGYYVTVSAQAQEELVIDMTPSPQDDA